MLPERLCQNAERLQRFRREALAAARLDHTNIATIYAHEDLDDLTAQRPMERSDVWFFWNTATGEPD